MEVTILGFFKIGSHLVEITTFRTEHYQRGNSSVYAKHDILGHELIIRLGNYLRWSNKTIEIVSNLVKDHLRDDSSLRDIENIAKK